jgi:hypothetical protein
MNTEILLAHKPEKTVEVVFNTLTISLPKGDHSGAEVKAFAIAEGVAIDLSFVLAVKRGHRFENVSDTDVVKVHAGQMFTAVAGDDNS